MYNRITFLYTCNYHDMVNQPSVRFSRSVVSGSLRPHELHFNNNNNNKIVAF